MTDCIRLFYDGRLINTITINSKFKHGDYTTIESAALALIEGWIENANYDRKLFRIEYGQTDPIVLSKQTQQMIVKSRENIGV